MDTAVQQVLILFFFVREQTSVEQAICCAICTQHNSRVCLSRFFLSCHLPVSGGKTQNHIGNHL